MPILKGQGYKLLSFNRGKDEIKFMYFTINMDTFCLWRR